MSTGPGREITDPGVLLEALEGDPVRFAYALGDLDPATRDVCRWWGVGEPPESLVMLYGGRWPTIVTMGDARGLAACLDAAELPEVVESHVELGHRAIVEARFDVERSVERVRMGVDRLGFRRPGDLGQVHVLAGRDRAELEAFYAAHYPGNFFDPALLDSGHYVGIGEDGRLVCAAGIHVIGRETRVACLANVATDAALRGQGLARRACGFLVERLLREVDTVALNVGLENAPARALYRRLGFADRMVFLEARLRRRP